MGNGKEEKKEEQHGEGERGTYGGWSGLEEECGLGEPFLGGGEVWHCVRRRTMYSWSYLAVLLRQELGIGFSWRAGVSWLSQLYVVEAQPHDRVAGSDKLAMRLRRSLAEPKRELEISPDCSSKSSQSTRNTAISMGEGIYSNI